MQLVVKLSRACRFIRRRVLRDTADAAGKVEGAAILGDLGEVIARIARTTRAASETLTSLQRGT